MLLAALLCLDAGAQEPPAATMRPAEEALPPAATGRAVDWGEDYQVRTHGGDPAARVVVNAFANELNRDFRRLLHRFRPGAGRDREWAVPIRIDLWGAAGEVHRGRDLATTVEVGPDNRLFIRVSVKLHDSLRESALRQELIQAFLFDAMLAPVANTPELLGEGKLQAPDWLVHGFDELIEHRRRGRSSAFFDGMLRSSRMLSPAEVLETADSERLDPVSFAIFRASSLAMVDALLEQPQGDQGLRAFLGELLLEGEANAEQLLLRHFPAFREAGEGMERWWALQLASLSQRQSFEFMGRDETERWLAEALTVRFPGDEEAPEAVPPARGDLLGRLRQIGRKEEGGGEAFTGGLEDYAQFLHRPGARQKLAECFDKLQILKRSGFPLYRPVFTGYEEVIEKLARGRTRGVDEELGDLAEMRGRIHRTLVEAEDYLNYFEATRAPRRSDAFDDYMDVRRALEETAPPPRNDRISRHLDALEREFR